MKLKIKDNACENITIPGCPVPMTHEYYDILKENYNNSKESPNNLSFWYPKIVDKGFKTPETLIIPLSFEDWVWLQCDKYEDERIQKFTDFINDKIKEAGFNTDRELFMKTGNFSGKFCFKHPYLKNSKDIENIGEHFLDLAYNGLCVGCPLSPEIVIREFIHTAYNRGTINDGMKLNDEFRIFVDFDVGKIIKCVPYWERDTMEKNLFREEDKNAFLAEVGNLEEDYDYLLPILKEKVNIFIPKVTDLSGKWSVDFMWDGQYFWLIDMAKAENSYYY